MRLAAGFDAPGAIRDFAVETFADDSDADELVPLADELTRELVVAQRRPQPAWPRVTDRDRLGAASAALERPGVVARQNFACCGACGAAEIGAELVWRRLAVEGGNGQDARAGAGAGGRRLGVGEFAGE